MSGHPRTYSIPGEWRAAKMDGVYGLPTPCNVTQMTSSLYFIDLSLAISSFLACAVALLLAFLLRLYKHFTYRLAMYQVFASFSCKADKEDLSQVNHYQIGWLTLKNTSCWKDHLENWDNVRAANTEDLDCLSVTPPYELLG